MVWGSQASAKVAAGAGRARKCGRCEGRGARSEERALGGVLLAGGRAARAGPGGCWQGAAEHRFVFRAAAGSSQCAAPAARIMTNG